MSENSRDFQKVVVEKLKLPFPQDQIVPMKISKEKRISLVQALIKHVKSIFDCFGGISPIIEGKKAAYIKPNGIDAKPYAYTRPEVLEALIILLKEAGLRDIFVFENSTQSNYTRIVFEASGYHEVCKRTGAKPIYLDEEETEEYQFSSRKERDYDREILHLSTTVVKELIENRERNFYVNLPKLKTHSMSGVTLGIKNQWAFPRHEDRKYDHNFNLHSKLSDVLRIVEPDFTIIDGVEGTIHGHYPATSLIEESVIPFRLLIGGTNVFATDLVGTRIFGLDIDDVPHLKLTKERGLTRGVNLLEDINIIGDLSPYTKKYPYDIIEKFPENVNMVVGKDLWCKEGCRNNPLMLLQVLYLDYGGKGKFDLIMGKGFNLDTIDGLEGPALVCGHCAIEEVGKRLVENLGKKNVYFSDGCNNLAKTAAAMLKLMKVNPMKLVDLNPLKGIWLLFLAKLHGSKANVPSPFCKWIKES